MNSASSSINAVIETKRFQILNTALELSLKKIEPTPQVVNLELNKDMPVREKITSDPLELWAQYINMKNLGPGTEKAIKVSYNTFKDFIEAEKISLTLGSFNLGLQDLYLQYLRNVQELNENTIGTRIKHLKMFLNHYAKKKI
jgi:hypothetical protein